MSALPYALVIIPFSTFVVTFCVGVGMFVVLPPLFWIPEKQRGITVGYLCGLLGEVAGWAYGYLIFYWLVGPDSFTIVPMCCAAIPLLFPPFNDWQHARKAASGEATLSDYKGVRDTMGTALGAAIGEVIGFLLGIYIFGVAL